MITLHMKGNNNESRELPEHHLATLNIKGDLKTLKYDISWDTLGYSNSTKYNSKAIRKFYGEKDQVKNIPVEIYIDFLRDFHQCGAPKRDVNVG